MVVMGMKALITAGSVSFQSSVCFGCQIVTV